MEWGFDHSIVFIFVPLKLFLKNLKLELLNLRYVKYSKILNLFKFKARKQILILKVFPFFFFAKAYFVVIGIEWLIRLLLSLKRRC